MVSFRRAALIVVALPTVAACSDPHTPMFDDPAAAGSSSVAGDAGTNTAGSPSGSAGASSTQAGAGGIANSGGNGTGGLSTAGNGGNFSGGSGGVASGGAVGIGGSIGLAGAGGAAAGAGGVGNAGGSTSQAGAAGAAGSTPIAPTYEVKQTPVYDLEYRGSVNGGVAFTLKQCPGSSVIVGLSIEHKVDAKPLAITLQCAQVKSDGSLGAVTNGPRIAQNSTSPTSTKLECPTGSVAVSMFGLNDAASVPSYISTLGLHCSPVKQWVAGAGTATSTDLVGTSLGAKFTDNCPTGYTLRGFSGRVGNLFDALRGHCVQIVKHP